MKWNLGVSEVNNAKPIKSKAEGKGKQGKGNKALSVKPG